MKTKKECKEVRAKASEFLKHMEHCQQCKILFFYALLKGLE